MRARRLPSVPPSVAAVEDPATADYAGSFQLIVPMALQDRTPEGWARATFEGAPAAVRWFCVAGWRLGLGLRLGPADDPGHVLGWRLADAGPDWARLEVESRILSVRTVVLLQGTTLLHTVFVWYRSPLARVLWPVTAWIHHPLTAYLLTRAAGDA